MCHAWNPASRKTLCCLVEITIPVPSTTKTIVATTTIAKKLFVSGVSSANTPNFTS